MASSKPTNTNTNVEDKLEDKIKELKISLPKQTWLNHILRHYQGFWCPDMILDPLIRFQNQQLQLDDTDIILCSLPKTGTTWSKSLIFSIINRNKFSNTPKSQHPLYTKNPHQLFFRFERFANLLDITKLSSPRLFATHGPYQSLPDSIKSSNSKIVYVCRNPIDTFVSTWHFCLQIEEFIKDIDPTMELMDELVTKFCNGVSSFGPYEDHILGYWNESKKNPHKVLVLEYEGLKKDPKTNLKKLAEFLGCPFSKEEEKGNVIEEIIELCSFKSLKEMEVNKTGRIGPLALNNVFFRKGEVGDWTNDLTPSMAERLDQLLRGKLFKAGFSFTYYHAKKIN